MKKLALAMMVTSALVAAPAFAGSITLDFETAPSFGSIDSLYAASGVTFGLDAQGLQNDALGPYFSNAPSPVGVMFVSGPNSAMNVSGGFYGLSFFYSSADVVTDALQVWSDTDGLGTRLATFDLQNNASVGCTDSAYCNWNFLSASWAGAARSVTFAAGTQLAAFDNVTVVPEPSSVLLAGLALTALVASRRRSC
jgi:hypothetical protein